jgi:GABA permease
VSTETDRTTTGSPSPPAGGADAADPQLSTGLKNRHLTMISIAGVIGAGLFVGSATAIGDAGPAVLLAYLAAGTLVVLVMRMLGEMATANPDTGSFSTYADRALGRWAGFSVGWLYWWFWVLVIPWESIVAGQIAHGFFPGVPEWAFSAGILLVLVATNLVSVTSYGEFEFWFALVKVVAIAAFIVVGVLAIAGVLPGDGASGLTQLTAHGFAPNGWSAVITAIAITMFSFMGTEIVTIAASESGDPVRGIHRATNSVIWRIGTFYLASIFIVVALVPFPVFAAGKGSGGHEIGTYGEALTAMGMAPDTAYTIVNIIVLTAVSSCLNSALYTASRMVYSLAVRGDAPASWARTSRTRVPVRAVLASTAVAVLCLVLHYGASGTGLFDFLLLTSGGIALVIYLVIAASQLVQRRRADARGERAPVRMWAFPVLTWATIAFIVVVMAVMAFGPSSLELYWTLALSAVTVVAGVIVQRRHHGRLGRIDADDDDEPARAH